VPRPPLTTRIEQPHPSPCEWVSCVGLRSFEPIAHPTREPEVLFRLRPAACLRDEVIDFQRPKHVLLDTETVPTALSCLFTETRTYGLCNVAVTHADKGFCNPRRTAS
jgi:hypothetical protein